MEPITLEIEKLKGIIGRCFSIYDVRMRPEAVSFYLRINPATMNENFERVRTELIPQGYIPLLRLDGGEHVIHVQRRPQLRYKGPWVNLILLGATMVTTVLAGMILWSSYGNVPFWSLENSAYGALYFSLPLLLILGVHEMGHYFMAKKHKVAASLPFFIPAPPIFPLGTFGAVISMREPIPNKRALLDIGIAGPLAGLAVAIPVSIIGLYLNSTNPVPVGPNIGGAMGINLPLLYLLLLRLFPLPENVLFHPTAFAGWVGLFVTALNLLPAGQLDGGHVARALLGEKSKYVSYAALAAMFGFSVLYTGWLIIALFILFLGARHPPPLNDITPLEAKRRALGTMAVAIMVLSFVLVPIVEFPEERGLEFRSFGDPSSKIETASINVTAGNTTNFTFLLKNTGNVLARITLRFGLASTNLIASNWSLNFTSLNGIPLKSNALEVSLNSSESAQITVSVTPPGQLQGPGPFTIDIVAKMEGLPEEKKLEIYAQVAT